MRPRRVKGVENMVDESCHPIPHDNGDFDVARSLRDIPPAHYTLKIESFSELAQLLLDAKVQNYESDIFEAGGYKWKLYLHPNGDKERNGEGHISLYLVIAETSDLPLGWEVNVNFKLFVYDQIQDKYMTIQDANGKVRRFHRMKTKWGFAQLLPLGTFNDAANGYLIHDTCVFGAEVLVINYNGRGECLTVLKGLDNTYTWKIDNFSSLDGKTHYSEVFTIGNRKWKLKLHPKGDSRANNKCLSLFLLLDDWKTFPSDRKTYAKYKLLIRNQCHGQHVETTDTACFAPTSGWGRSSFLSLTDLHDASKGFLVKDTLIVEAEVSVLSTLKNFSEYVARSLRDIPPAHYTLKIESFAQLAQLLSDATVQNCESGIFEASDYKWDTSLYANGKLSRFHRMRTESGFAQLLPLTTFNDSSNGYLIHDTCVFGAEVFVINYAGRRECLTVLKGLVTSRTWKIDKSSSLDDKVHYSDVFTIENL
ncbi:unnamed protein product [Camellia sinensis]